jgi:signal transduction histidine kinase
MLLCTMLTGCRSRQPSVKPFIEFTTVPLAGEGGPDRVAPIEGHVVGFRPQLRIVLYAHWGIWWVQPLADRPFTEIQSDSTWRNSTHFGTDYAAVLVEPGYHPAARMDGLPSKGDGVVAVAVVEGRPVFWQTWWFRLCSLLAFVLAVLALIRLRMLRLTTQMSVRFEERLGERTRIARELHDTLLQGFHGLLLRFQTVSNQLPEGPAKQRLDSAIDQAAQTITESRDAVQQLRSSAVVTNDLAFALSALGDELTADEINHNSALFRVEVEGTPRNLHPILRDEVYRIAAEAMRNAFQHAQAQQIEVEILYEERQLRLRVRDDGKGVDPKLLHDEGRPGHWGLRGMHERAKLVGAHLNVRSKLDSGTEVDLSVPASVAYATSPASRRRWLSGKGTEMKS